MRNLTPNITKGQTGSKIGKKMVKFKRPIDIPFMSAIFVMFTQFIYAHDSL